MSVLARFGGGIGARMIAMGVSLVIMCAAITVALVYWQGGGLQRQVAEETDQLVSQQVAKQAQCAYSVCLAQQASALREIKLGLGLARDVVTRFGPASLAADQRQQWAAIDQFSKKTTPVSLPTLNLGQTPLVMERDSGRPSPVVDRIAEVTGASCTIFQWSPELQGMLRVATTIVTKDKLRAVGTYIPKTSQGAPDPVLAQVLAGKSYFGRAFVLDSWYVTGYEPLRGPDGAVVGMLYVGFKQDEVLGPTREVIMGMRVGQEGYAYALHASGPQKGAYAISKGGQEDGKNILETTDADGKPFIKEMIEQALADKPGEVRVIRYPWKRSGESRPRVKIAAFTYFPAWDWILAVGAYEEEFQETSRRVGAAFGRMILNVALGCGLAVFLAALLGWLVSRRLSRPLVVIGQDLAGRAGSVAQASEQISASSQNLSEAVSQQAASLEQSAASLEEVASLAKSSVQGAEESENLMERTTLIVQQAGNTLDRLKKAMQNINDASQEMSGIIRTIDEIAFQTNLLSLNAAVESARAGEAGAGFAVVAQEVRSLALRAAQAAKGTQELIEANMNRVRDGQELVEQADQAFANVAQGAGQTSRLMSQLTVDFKNQAMGLEQISQAMAEMDKATQQAMATAEEAAAAAEEMAAQATSLHGMSDSMLVNIQGHGVV